MRTFFILLFVFAGCSVRPPDPKPPAPHIESFSVSKGSLLAGETVTISWRVANATDLELREATLGSLGISATELNGSIDVKPTVNSTFVLTARNDGGTDARAIAVTVAPTLAEFSFHALPSSISGGDVSTLVWTAPNARRVSLRAGATNIDTRSQLTAGAVTVRPLEDTTYTLDVDGELHTTTVTVQPGILEFTARATAVEVGSPIHLAWRTAGATNVRLNSVGRGELFTSTSQTDTFTEAAPSGGVVTYELVVEKGAERMTRTLEVFVGVDLTVTRLSMPTVAPSGGTYFVRWETVAADEIEVRIDGLVAFTTANPSSVSVGLMSVPTPSDDFEVEFIAIDRRGPRSSRRTQVDVVGIPNAVTLVATPTTVTAGSAVTLRWNSLESRHVRITDGDGQPVYSVTGIGAENGSTTVFPPHAGTTYRITADNTLGSAPVSASASVVVTGTALDVTQSPRTAFDGTKFTAVANDAQATLIGFPHDEVLHGTRAEFIDISATGQRLDIVNSPGVTAVATNFDTWLWGEKQNPLLVISRSGWMSFGAPDVNVASDVALPSSFAPRRIIAPFFDDLRMTSNSSMWWQVLGDAPNERIIVQWSRMQIGADTNTELTFQAHVHQNGSIAFHYEAMRMPPLYVGFVIGVQDAFARRAVTTDIVPSSDSALYFFSPVSGTANLTASRRSNWGGFVQKNGVSALISRAAQVVAIPEDLAITEVQTQQITLLNRTATPLDLSNWTLANVSIPSGFTLALDAPTAVSTAMLDGGSFFFGVNDAGVTVDATPRIIDSGFGYRSRAIASHFVDITDGGTALINGLTVDAQTIPIVLGASPQPRVFGDQLGVVSMSVDGFLVPASSTLINGENKTSVSMPQEPRGLIAPFWDDLQTAPGGGLWWKFIAANEDPLRPEPHWIFQWHHVRHLNTQPPDDLNFEVKLFENGVIEYHYGVMRSGTTAGYADGSSATVWLERADAGTALIESINAPLIRPHTAIRFTPQ